MLINLGQARLKRAYASNRDARARAIQTAGGISFPAAQAIARMEIERRAVDLSDIGLRPGIISHAMGRNPAHRMMLQIHKALGPDSTLTDRGEVALTPIGRLRLRAMLGEPVL